jgi:hypothetical protein
MNDTDQINAIGAQLRTFVSDPSDIYNVTAGDAGFVFWGLPLTNDQVTNVPHKRAGHPSEPVTLRVLTRFYKQSSITNPLFIICPQIQKEE